MLIAAGGSGGHVFPGITLAKYFKKNNWQVIWIGTKNGIESKMIPKYGIKIFFINIEGIVGKKIKTLILSPIKILYACYQSIKIIKKISPKVILVMGGYVSGPVGIAAKICKIPLLVHEQNTVAGITNKILSKISNINMQAFSNTLNNAYIVGNPIREEILNINKPLKRFQKRKGKIRILILGGSQGSIILNNVIVEVAKKLKNNIKILHQTGNKDFFRIKKIYLKNKLFQHQIVNFIKNIDEAYEWTDMIIGRSGALTVSEILSINLPSILIPYNHKDKQQYFNALILKKMGIAKIISEKNLSVKKILEILKIWNRKEILRMICKSQKIDFKNSTKKIFNLINDL
ncbi:undecaprenyldiphospho-muramoylpentapeptide beta-N-acetylglucosaminyltransferase [Buchnera aphidicola (Neophyllaphis varicolor)]|uniref:undecaprenyldiphospho-muramoylpentapeptide beta-N-acetylglucosaminyltransferase n=1 Tax=Buchnera aphidicola TaxID=9 RepID=UPI0031B7F423